MKALDIATLEGSLASTSTFSMAPIILKVAVVKAGIIKAIQVLFILYTYIVKYVSYM